MGILLKAIYMFSAVVIKIPMTFIIETEKSTINSFGNARDQE
jgi:hypothetical protein